MDQISPRFEKTGVIVSPSQIQYTFISPNESYRTNSFFEQAFEMLRECPKDLLQLQDSGDYFDFCSSLAMRKSINLFMLPNDFFSGNTEDDVTKFMFYSRVFNKDIIKVFLVDNLCNSHQSIGSAFKGIPFSYFHITGEPDESISVHYDLHKCFNDSHQLIALIKKDLHAINQEITKEYDFQIKEFDFAIHPKADELNPYYPTLYTKNNYFTLNQILANYWNKMPKESKKEELVKSYPNRVRFQISQIEVIDKLHLFIKKKKPVTPIEPLLPSMIIVAPFHFPRYGKMPGTEFKSKLQKKIIKLYQTEQQLDYRYLLEIDESDAEHHHQAQLALSVLTSRLLALDNIGFLHAQFDYAPFFRLPIIGKSLNMDLSHFQSVLSNKRHAIEKVKAIGETMREHLIHDELKNLLTARNGQLVFISDLPMEWLRLNKHPICLTHDVCRIPEFNINSLVNNFVHNQRLNFRIQPDILKRTLVVHCASDTDNHMNNAFALIDSMKPMLGFTSVKCKTVLEINEAVKKHKPDFLIFDCHGDFDEKTLSSYLVVDSKNGVLLRGEDIIEYQISAPLVFISACNTLPNYGYVKFLTDAFFQAGAFAVTATFMPIKIAEAATLVIRILNNLKQHENKVIHFNWLSFISHTLRGAFIFEAIKQEQLRHNPKRDVDNSKIAEILTELMIFEKRSDAYESLKKYLRSLNPDSDIIFDNLEHEWLSYSTVGRADLIFFQNWLDKHQENNLGTAMFHP